MSGGTVNAKSDAARGLVQLILALTLGSLIVLVVLLFGSIALSSRVESALVNQAEFNSFVQNMRDVDMHHDAIGASVFRTALSPNQAATNLVRTKQDVTHVLEETTTWASNARLVNDGNIAARLPHAVDVVDTFSLLGQQLLANPQLLSDKQVLARFSASYENVGLVLAGIIQALDSQQISASQQFNTDSNNLRTVIIVILVLFALLGVILGTLALARARQLSGRLQHTMLELRGETSRRRIDADLREGLDLVDSEEHVIGVVQSWLPLGFPHSTSEVILMDSSRAHLEVSAVHGEAFAACSVDQPQSCPAIRRAGPLAMPDSNSPTACPYLRERGPGLAAACAPITFGSRTIGVLHVVGSTPSQECFDRATMAGSILGVRIGSLRAFGTAKMQASTDSLTGLQNRRATEEALSQMIESNVHVVVAMLDIDHFKHLNDVHGHHVGDSSLRTFAGAVRQTMREGDIAGRFGGEEFVLAFRGANEEQASVIIERLRDHLLEACAATGSPKFTFSAGLAAGDETSTMEDLLRLADHRLLAAKAAGRDRTITSTSL